MAAGYKDFTAGAVLTAADLEDYNQNQSIMRFASAAARDAALTTVKTEGMMAYLIDLNVLTVYSGAAWSTVGPVHGALTSWTPAVVQSGSVTSTVGHCVYSRIGRLVWASLMVNITGTGTAANDVTVSLPVNCAFATTTELAGYGYIRDVSAVLWYRGPCQLVSASTFKIQASPFTYGLYFGTTDFTAALANTDQIAANITYEAAADA